MKSRKPDKTLDDTPHEAPYEEDASVPGDNDVRTALDPKLEEESEE